jgi:penicillin-binding protein 2
MFNRAIGGVYPPGSTYKLISSVASLEEGAVTRETLIEDTGVITLGPYKFPNWYFLQYGKTEGLVDVVKALARSNDIYFYKTAEWLGPDKLSDIAKMLGFGKKTGIELPAEANGIVPNPAWKEKAVGEKWYLGDTYHFGIGQGDLLVTPVQMFEAMTMFANKGKLCAPSLLKEKTGNCQDISVSADHLNLIRTGMEAACTAGGTGYPFFPWNSSEGNNKVMCKTGTAEFGAADANGHRKTHAWFVGFTTLDTKQHEVQFFAKGKMDNGMHKEQYPKDILVVVLVESDENKVFREGSADGAPIALEIMKWIKEHR